jgi:RNA polymerase sigma factor (sigma-70 family)
MSADPRPLDPLLRAFVEAVDESAAERELERLVEDHALPLARAIVGRKMRSYHAGAASIDREDLVSDAIVGIVEQLWRLREAPDRVTIENFASYTAAIVFSVCAHDIRRRFPERARLKSRLRYMLSTDRRFALWTGADEEATAGLAAWTGRAADAGAERRLSGITASGSPWAALTPAQLADALVSAMTTAGAPVTLEALLSAAAAGMVEPRTIGEPEAIGRSPQKLDSMIDQRRLLQRVWDEIVALPVRQRVALLLNLRDSTGSGLLWLLPIAGVATLRQIARVLEIPDRELARLWPEIPLDDASIGERLGCARQQVINLRMAARKRLVNRLGRADVAAGLSTPAANFAAVSSSLKGSA